jgi:hypothetical protein
LSDRIRNAIGNRIGHSRRVRAGRGLGIGDRIRNGLSNCIGECIGHRVGLAIRDRICLRLGVGLCMCNRGSLRFCNGCGLGLRIGAGHCVRRAAGAITRSEPGGHIIHKTIGGVAADRVGITTARPLVHIEESRQFTDMTSAQSRHLSRPRPNRRGRSLFVHIGPIRRKIF